MPTLDWIGKAAVVTHHKDVPYRLLEPVAELSFSQGERENGNLIVQGDNLHALKALLPRYAGQVKCIYIDPPYNTGNEGWAYNDNVNSPEMRRWLGETVGKEGETLDRHDRCRFDAARLKVLGLGFRQLPYELAAKTWA